jgi:hypothetical protein
MHHHSLNYPCQKIKSILILKYDRKVQNGREKIEMPKVLTKEKHPIINLADPLFVVDQK